MRYKIAIAALAITCLLAVPLANADVVRDITMSFQSGATFTGKVSFANDFSSVTGVTGVLNGYQAGVAGYNASFTDTISWIWYPGQNFATGANTFGTFLMDGTGYEQYSHWISFTYNFSGAPVLTFAGIGFGNNVDYLDPLVSGSLAPVPEPASLALLGAGAGLLGIVRRRLGL